MRPPPKWLPPEPPSAQIAADRFESNYEDPEDMNRNHGISFSFEIQYLDLKISYSNLKANNLYLTSKWNILQRKFRFYLKLLDATRAFLLQTAPGKSTDHHSYEMSLSKQVYFFK